MSKRLFVSIDLDGLADDMETVQDRFAAASGFRATDPTQTHVTLKFLGDTDPDRIPDVVTALETAIDDSGVEPLEVDFGGLGVFPSLDYISVVWVGVRTGGTQLTALHGAIEDRMTGLGFDAAVHEFTPHATVGRMDNAGGKDLVQRVVREADPDVGCLPVDGVRLTESTLQSDGPEYRTIENISF